MKIKSQKLEKSKIRKILQEAENQKPQFGNSRSFSCNSKRRVWKINKQKVSFNKKNYFISCKAIKLIRKQILSQK